MEVRTYVDKAGMINPNLFLVPKSLPSDLEKKSVFDKNEFCIHLQTRIKVCVQSREGQKIYKLCKFQYLASRKPQDVLSCQYPVKD